MEKLIFVYNADSGKLNSLLDSLHKVVSPSTYDCKLCALTHGLTEEKKSWREFRQNLDLETEFLHRDEFRKQYASKFGHKFEFPLILFRGNKGLEVFVSKEEISQLNSIQELMRLIDSRLNAI
ncbi:GTPase [Gramella sp. GC03-9]|uniref:GTPase n=1 Tax=Christiangramia oceanisediminis TaxID=2920386 RepID=A0A9X2L028_9FLAO|nr:GTPase [Gramella oceanisediminis]MCP9201482.1 GTPase [Gramella oceanisediminis]